jgi:uncharacterized protein
MPQNPGVYIEDAAGADRVVVGVETSIAAFLGRARRGPSDRPVRVRRFAEFEQVFGGLWEASTLGYAVQQFFLNGGADAFILRLHNGAAAATSTLIAGFDLVAASEGDWGERLRVRVDYETRDPTDSRLFNLSVRDMATGWIEQFPNVSTQSDDPRFVANVLERQSHLIRVSGSVDGRPPPNASPPPGADPFDTPYSNGFNADGDDGGAIGAAHVVDPQLEASRRGLWMLDQIDIFNLLCIPPFARENGDVPRPVWDTAAAYCARRHAFLIVDPPQDWRAPADVVAGVDDLIARVDAAALYFPRIMAADPLDGLRQASFAPCGVIAGVMARTDAGRGVWKAPAGLDALMIGVTALSLGGAPGLLSDSQMGVLNSLGVDCLRKIPNGGHAVWGARTLAGADVLGSQWKYIPVRRLASHVEESLLRGTRWAVFEPNGEPLWAQIRLHVGAFMQGLFRQGAFAGARPQDGYFVKCSAETTTQADIDSGVVNILVGFAPLRPAEFVVIDIRQLAQQ